jgi:hypothetical protein
MNAPDSQIFIALLNAQQQEIDELRFSRQES